MLKALQHTHKGSAFFSNEAHTFDSSLKPMIKTFVNFFLNQNRVNIFYQEKKNLGYEKI